MAIALPIVLLLSVLSTPRQWFAPAAPVEVTVKADQPVELVLTDFAGKRIEARADVKVDAGVERTITLTEAFVGLDEPGAYIVYEVPQGQALPAFVGTPLVVTVRKDRRRGVPPGEAVTRVDALKYLVIDTGHGPIRIGMYYDVAPHTTDTVLAMAEQGYYDGMLFHRIVPGFVIQGGDPKGDGTGGPGFTISQEFNDRPHEAGVLSIARVGDPQEPGAPPRPEYANSGGTQFFICLDYGRTQQLDGRYTAFAKVFDGMDAVRAIASAQVLDKKTGRPVKPQPMLKVSVRPVTPGDNPYPTLLATAEPPAPQAATAPTTPASP